MALALKKQKKKRFISIVILPEGLGLLKSSYGYGLRIVIELMVFLSHYRHDYGFY
jgi:hypothetical protein